MKKSYIAAIAAGAVVIALGAYFYSYRDKYYPGTTIDNINVGGLTVAKAEKKLQEHFSDTKVTIKTSGEPLTVNISDIATYSSSTAKDIMKNKGFLVGKDYKDKSSITFDSNKLSDYLKKQNVLWQNRTNTANASSSYDASSKKFVIHKEVYGNEFTSLESLTKEIMTELNNKNYNINVETSKYYKQPAVKSTDMEETVKTLNNYVGKTITLKDDNQTYTLTSDDYAPHLSAQGKEISVDESWIKNYVASLASKVNTRGKATSFTAPNGQVINVKGGTYGKVLSTKTEREQIKQDILSGKDVTRNLNFTSYGNKTLNSDVIIVNIAAQTVTAFKNGQQILNASVVTGKMTPDRMTDYGLYYIFHKRSPAVLKGDDYQTPVNFFAAFHNGEGFHDADGWRKAYGGNIYINSGSHGCVNMRYNDAKTIYNNFAIGTPVAVIQKQDSYR